MRPSIFDVNVEFDLAGHRIDALASRSPLYLHRMDVDFTNFIQAQFLSARLHQSNKCGDN